eukprot:Em0020g1066a
MEPSSRRITRWYDMRCTRAHAAIICSLQTTSVNLVVKAVSIDEFASVELYLCDCAGKELFSDFVNDFWDHPGGVMVVYDVTDKQSFASCAKWLERVKAKKAAVDVPLPGVLVANKIDLVDRRVVSKEEGMAFAASKELQYFECSAKDGLSTDSPFKYLAEMFHKLYEEKLETLKSIQ